MKSFWHVDHGGTASRYPRIVRPIVLLLQCRAWKDFFRARSIIGHGSYVKSRLPRVERDPLSGTILGGSWVASCRSVIAEIVSLLTELP
jgi:hypothetical protein